MVPQGREEEWSFHAVYRALVRNGDLCEIATDASDPDREGGIHAMPELKTRPTTASVTGFIERQPDEQTRADCLTLVALMEQVTGEKAVMWGPSIIGFGTYRLVYADGSEADWPIAGFSPRKKDLTIYLTCW